jgi:hypothetical protein
VGTVSERLYTCTVPAALWQQVLAVTKLKVVPRPRGVGLMSWQGTWECLSYLGVTTVCIFSYVGAAQI